MEGIHFLLCPSVWWTSSANISSIQRKSFNLLCFQSEWIDKLSLSALVQLSVSLFSVSNCSSLTRLPIHFLCSLSLLSLCLLASALLSLFPFPSLPFAWSFSSLLKSPDECEPLQLMFPLASSLFLLWRRGHCCRGHVMEEEMRWTNWWPLLHHLVHYSEQLSVCSSSVPAKENHKSCLIIKQLNIKFFEGTTHTSLKSHILHTQNCWNAVHTRIDVIHSMNTIGSFEHSMSVSLCQHLCYF